MKDHILSFLWSLLWIYSRYFYNEIYAYIIPAMNPTQIKGVRFPVTKCFSPFNFKIINFQIISNHMQVYEMNDTHTYHLYFFISYHIKILLVFL